ncbi:MAG: FGGY-family carbohydrate kinase [Promethearchaeota archaeon]
MDKYIVAHDLGTSGNKAVLVSTRGDVLGASVEAYEVSFPKPGWAEQNPQDWWNAVCSSTKKLLEETGVSPADVVGTTFSSQMVGLVPIDGNGQPVMNCMIWMDTRSEQQAKRLVKGLIRVSGYGLGRLRKWLKITGGGPSLAGKDPVSKIMWLREERPDLWADTRKLLDVGGYLLLRSTGRYLSSVDQAHVWWLMDTRKESMGWSDDLLKLAGVPKEMMPEIVRCSDVVGKLDATVAAELGLQEGTPVVAGTGDVAAAAVGSGAVREKEVHLYIGTSSWVCAHVQDRALDIFTSTGAICSAHPEKYLIVAEQETAGGCLEWAKNQLYHAELLMREEGKENLYQIFDEMVAKCEPGAKGLMFTPWMFGERVPVDDHSIRASILNLSLDHDRNHLMRALFEGIALNSKWALNAVEKLTKEPASHVNFIGGGAKSDVWCQVFADVLGRPIRQVVDPQMSGARGVALVAAYGLGYLDDFEQIADLVKVKKTFEPRPQYRGLYDEMFSQFVNYYKRNKSWFRKANRTH